MKNLLPLQKESLYEETKFIRFCNRDEYGSPKLNTDISKDFLACAEKDGLLLPIITTKENQIVDGKKKQINKKYYSPFQVFQVLMLCQNKITPDGLMHPKNEEYLAGSQSPTMQKYIKWGDDDIFELFSDSKSIKEILKNFHNLLSLLHSQVFTGHRYFVNYPKPDIDLDFIEKDHSLIRRYNLNEKKLNQIRYIIGSNALRIDPLEKLYYYIERHPRNQKDWLKGKAILSQDLYLICDIIVNILKITTGNDQKLLPELIYHNKYISDFYTTEYADGIDILAIKKTLTDLKECLGNKKCLQAFQFIKKNAPYYLKDETINRLAPCEKELDEFISLYGSNRRHLSGSYEIEEENTIAEDKLDSKAYKIWEQLMKISTANFGNGITRYPEIAEKIKNNDLGKKDGLAISLEREKRRNISLAIERRMDELKREVSEIANELSRPFRYYIDDLEKKNELIDISVYREPLPTQLQGKENQGELIKYYNDKRIKMRQEIEEKIDWLQDVVDNLDKIGASTWNVLCGKCRKNYVLLKHGYQEQALFSDAFCEECIKSGLVPSIKHKCSNCGSNLIYYAHENTISSKLQNQADAKFVLEYGKLKIEIKCQKCSDINTIILTSGFSP